MTGRRHVVIAGGGTGGHVFEAVAVARALLARGRAPGTVHLVGSRRGQESVLLAGIDLPVTLLPGRGIVRRPQAIIQNLSAIAALWWSAMRMLASMTKRRPGVVVSVGGYASFPALLAAVFLRVPVVLVNIDAVPGLVHRIFGRFAAASAVAFPDTPLPRSVVTGTPVRDEIRMVERTSERAKKARDALGLPAGRFLVAVVGGSLGARRLNDAAVDLAHRWESRDDRMVFHVIGRRSWQGDERSSAGYMPLAFAEHMDQVYEAADVMVCRAGAVTVAELSVVGMPAVLVPLPGAPGDHQTANARALEGVGAALLIPDDACTGERLAEELDHLAENAAAQKRMAEAARGISHPDAAERVAELVDEKAGTRGA